MVRFSFQTQEEPGLLFHLWVPFLPCPSPQPEAQGKPSC